MNRYKLVFTLLVFIGWTSNSMAENWIFGLGVETRLNQAYNDRDIEVDQFPNTYLAYQLHPWQFSLELSRFEKQTSSGNLLIDLVHTEVMAWTHFTFVPYSGVRGLFGLGRGIVDENVNTKLGSQSVNSGESPLWQSGLGAGVMYDLWRELFARFDVKMLLLDENSSEVLMSYALRFGWKF